MIYASDASVPAEIDVWRPFRDDVARRPRDLGFLRMIGRLRPEPRSRRRGRRSMPSAPRCAGSSVSTPRRARAVGRAAPAGRRAGGEADPPRPVRRGRDGDADRLRERREPAARPRDAARARDRAACRARRDPRPDRAAASDRERAAGSARRRRGTGRGLRRAPRPPRDASGRPVADPVRGPLAAGDRLHVRRDHDGRRCSAGSHRFLGVLRRGLAARFQAQRLRRRQSTRPASARARGGRARLRSPLRLGADASHLRRAAACGPGVPLRGRP